MSAAIGVALAAGWLQFIYEHLVLRGSVMVPKWWVPLQFVSFSLLVVFSLVLHRQDPKLSTICLRMFVFSFIGCLIQEFFGYGYVVA